MQWERGSDYRASLKVKVKVLDFIKSGGPSWAVDRSVFEMWMGLSLLRRSGQASPTHSLTG